MYIIILDVSRFLGLVSTITTISKLSYFLRQPMSEYAGYV